MNIFVVYPQNSHAAYKIAADEFVALAKRVGGRESETVTDAEFLALEEKPKQAVLIGNDSSNDVLAAFLLDGKISPLGFRYGTDGYTVRSEKIDETEYLILAGGRPRSTIYAVYRYFEKFCGCRWFWDGDRIPCGNLPFADISICEAPRFEYRGIRYFAHRSLHRFQAEQWGFEDWKCEIDWLLKSRLNLFMLRIGTDDLFQKAFPDIVPYPDRDLPLPESANGYDDRNLFWSLEYRGELRKKILQYAFERDLMHPDDVGTMTHWYSRTPIAFLEKKKPTLLSQSTKGYSEQTGLVFDIREKKNMEYYEHLTDTHVKEYGRGEIFHTIGFAERMYSRDRAENLRMKLFLYRRIAENLRKKYPNAPLLLASWDIWMCYTPEEAKALLAELDPNQTIFFDYTSEAENGNDFTKWNLLGKFPWIFGIFGGYEKHHDIRGNFALMNERLSLAKKDAMCRGMVFWPEFSHGNPLNLYYLSKNAWEEDTPSIDALLEGFCEERYEKENAGAMLSIWKKILPIARLMPWAGPTDGTLPCNDLFEYIQYRALFNSAEIKKNETILAYFMETKDAALQILSTLTQISLDDEKTRRDAYDIARTVISRFINAAILHAELCFANGDEGGVEKASQISISLLEAFCLLLGGHEDYSLLASLERLKTETDTNPNFEKTLKNNAECDYNRAHIYENAVYLYLPETRLWLSAAIAAAKAGIPLDTKGLTADLAKIRAVYFETPLAEMKRESMPLAEVAEQAKKFIGELKKEG